MRWETVPLGEVARVVSGATPKTGVPEYWGGPIPWATPAELSRLGSSRIHATERTLTEAGFSSSGVNILPVGSVLLSSRAPIGLVAINTVPMGTNQGFKSLVPSDRVLAPFLYWWLKSHTALLQSKGRGATFLELSKAEVERLQIPLPPLPEQRRIAAILDEADAVGKSVGRRIALFPALLARAYDKLFGDPRSNPREWPIRQLGDIALKVSDGPFGSNLKSAHYTNSGVRVVRLQNIGVDEFLGAVAAYISEDHFERLRRHELLEGDVVVGTLGDPILRACVVPEGLGRAINKADCVQIRPDQSLATGMYLSATLNHRSMVKSAQSLAHGQTRSRISMSQVRALGVPVPPLGLQREFGELRSRYSAELAAMYSARRELDELFASLQHRAFRGEL